MSISLVLKRSGTYTSLDFVDGEVHLDLSKSEEIEKVIVKLEGLQRLATLIML